MVRIGIYPKHFDFQVNLQALQNSPEFEVHLLETEPFPDLDFLLIQGLEGDFPIAILERYNDVTKIVWQTGIWYRRCGRPILDWINIADFFMGYDSYIEKVATLKGKKIWKFPPLFADCEVLNCFKETRSNFQITTANLWHGGKLGYFPLRIAELNRRCTIFYSHLWEEEEILTLGIDKLNFSPVLPGEEYLQFLDNCSFVCQITEGVAWGKCILDAVRIGVPAIANTFYQRIFYPDLYCESIREMKSILNCDYEWFRKHVETAQAILKYLISDEAKNDFIEYLLSGGENGIPRWPLRDF